MSVNKLGKFFVIGLSAAFIVGCSSTASDTDSSSTTETTAETSAESTDTSSGAAEGGSVVVDDADSTDSGATSLEGVASVFYFDFDQSIVRPEAREALAIHAKYLVENTSAQVVLEGHADERGTREYNMALGERRAKAISRYLTIQGVSATQIETVSFGEEKAANFAHTDAAWQENRRVEVRYE